MIFHHSSLNEHGPNRTRTHTCCLITILVGPPQAMTMAGIFYIKDTRMLRTLLTSHVSISTLLIRRIALLCLHRSETMAKPISDQSTVPRGIPSRVRSYLHR